ncbi:MAG: hypothetical protein KJ626_06700 [Verrucomicrobia bacterium]|nr:hypothetical protein [Verrucomicrobiota bacterium]
MNRGDARLCSVLVSLLSFLVAGAAISNPIHVTYLWHMHQPIYYPYESVNATDAAGRYIESVGGYHDERAGNYTSWPKDAVQQGADRGMDHAGAQCSFSGSLGENLNGYWGGTWYNDYRWARNSILTSRGNPRLDMVGIANHHSLMPLTCKESMIMQIRLHKEVYQDLWDTTGYSKGFWPPECAFSESMIPALVEEGLEWVIVDNGHFDRACQNYPWVDATSIRPNPADQINPDPATIGSEWVQLNNVWAPSKVSAPWGYQPHYVKYVNPETGAEQKIVAVPAARYEGNENGRGGYGAFKPETVWGAHVDAGVNNDASKPMLMLCHSDGDNFGMKNSDAWHAQHGYFLDMCQSDGRFENTTVQDYLEMFPPDVNDVIHAEPGSWIGIDGGTPYFDKWREWNPGEQGDPNEHPDYWSWSVIVAAQNRVLHADALEDSYSMNDVQWGIGADTAKAWHFYLQAETSCHWYWDYDRANPWDGNATRGCNLAVAEANKVIGRHANDPVGPSIFPPQRNIYNPGGKHWNESTNQASDFQVWSFIDDASGVSQAKVMVRTDNDGQNPINENDNEVYAQNAAKVGAWTAFAMSGTWYPVGHGPMVPDPAVRAKYYTADVTGYNNVLLDYYIEAVDAAGNTNRSDIMHVWVGESGVVSPVTFQPTSPQTCDDLITTYNSATRSLSGANPVTLQITFDDWITTNEFTMSGTVGGLWKFTNDIPETATEAKVRFRNGGTVDQNTGSDWSISISECVEPSSVIFDPPSPNGCVPVTITYDPADGVLKDETNVYIHVGYNDWQGATTPDPLMTAGESNTWTYVYAPGPGTFEIDCAFNDGGGVWDSNNGLDWKISVANCHPTNPPAWFDPVGPRDDQDLVTHHDPGGRALDGVSPVHMVITFDEWLSSSQYQMVPASDGSWVVTNDIPVGSPSAIVYFRNGDGSIVDNNSGNNWSVEVDNVGGQGSGMGIVYGSPVITDDPADQNNADDAFDFDLSGGAASTTDQGGFGSFGSVCANYDETNFYIGAHGCSMVGDNNGMIIFLNFSSVSPADTVNNLWDLSGDPQGVDNLHNVSFSENVYIAILLGDEWGDGQYRNFGLGNGYDFGQGVFYTSTGVHSNFALVPGAKLSQYDGLGTAATSSNDLDGNRLMNRWEACIPWAAVNATGIESVTNICVYGLIASDGTSGNDRYISGNYLGENAGGTIDTYGNYGFNFVNIEPVKVALSGVDTDGDGLPDWWESKYFGSITGAMVHADFDNDGFGHGDEFKLGTHPKSRSSTFVVSHVTENSTQATVTWSTIGGKSYMVEYSDGLMGGFSEAVSVTEDDVASGRKHTETYIDDYTDTGGAPANGFRAYRVRLVE